MLKIRRSLDRLIFNMGIFITRKTVSILIRGLGHYKRYDYLPLTIYGRFIKTSLTPRS